MIELTGQSRDCANERNAGAFRGTCHNCGEEGHQVSGLSSSSEIKSLMSSHEIVASQGTQVVDTKTGTTVEVQLDTLIKVMPGAPL